MYKKLLLGFSLVEEGDSLTSSGSRRFIRQIRAEAKLLPACAPQYVRANVYVVRILLSAGEKATAPCSSHLKKFPMRNFFKSGKTPNFSPLLSISF